MLRQDHRYQAQSLKLKILKDWGTLKMIKEEGNKQKTLVRLQFPLLDRRLQGMEILQKGQR